MTSGIKRTMKDCIPVIRYRVLPAPFPTDRMRDLEAEAQEAMSDICRGLNLADDQRILTRLKRELGQEHLRNQREVFQILIAKLADAGPEALWKDFHPLMGNLTISSLSHVISSTGRSLLLLKISKMISVTSCTINLILGRRRTTYFMKQRRMKLTTVWNKIGAEHRPMSKQSSSPFHLCLT